jgi:RHS repeat-associated protein
MSGIRGISRRSFFTRHIPDGSTTWSYDGNKVQITRSSRITTQTYDAPGRLITVTDASGKVFDYTYDVMDNLIHVTHPNDVTCTDRVFVYDGLGRLLSGTHPETGTVTYTYYDSGRVASLTKASGLMTHFSYDNIYRHRTAPTTYIYDNLNRLTHAQDISGRGFTYTYDSVGNMLSLSKTNPVETATFSYINNRVAGLTYDTDGNLTDDGVNIYDYDALGQTASITHSGGVTEYRYDAMGKRLVKTDAAGDRMYLYPGELFLSEYDPVSGQFTDSIFMNGQLRARVIDDSVTTDVVYAHVNHLGSPVAFTNDIGTVVWPEQNGSGLAIHHYEPFGADFDDIGTPPLSDQDIRYTGKLFESDTGKHYFNARYLNAVTDTANPELPPRFLTPDIIIGTPANPQSWNRYVSMANNPVTFIDLDGNEVRFLNERAQVQYELYKESLPKDSQYYYDLIALETSKVIYIIGISGNAPDPKGTGGRFSALGEPGNSWIQIHLYETHDWPIQMRLAHELRHAVQFENRRLAFKYAGDNRWEPVYYDLTDEMDAFDAQIAGYGPVELKKYNLHSYQRKSTEGRLKYLKRLYPDLKNKTKPENVPQIVPEGFFYNVP